MLMAAAVGPGGAQRFYPDDPLLREPAPRPVEQAVPRKLSDYWDLVSSTLATPGEKQSAAHPIPAQAVNTLGDPMEGAWWERRHYWRRMSLQELQRGPGNTTPPSMEGAWTVVSAKTEGITPGFVILDKHGRRYFVKFDPPSNPEMATGADQISLHLFYALGYHVPENYLVYFKEENLQLGKDVTVQDGRGRKRLLSHRDLTEILMRVRREPDGRYRATASLAAAGKPIGPYRYHGTRSDDPNDITPHEHRRDLRGMHLAAAWINHDDSRAINTLDVLTPGTAGKFIQHLQLDFGSTLGSGSDKPNSPRSGGEYLFGWNESLLQLVSLGMAVPAWARAHYPALPAVGRFESKVFDPERWVPEYPNPAFLNRLPDDEFWMAKQIVNLSDDDIGSVVETAKYSDRRATDWIVKCLIERRNKIGRAVFRKVLPFDRFQVRNRRIEWENIALAHGLGDELKTELQWSKFDNKNQTSTLLEGENSATLPAMKDEGYWVVRLASKLRPRQTILVFLRNSSRGAEVVGLERTW